MKRMERTFIPGSKWIYIKLYCGSKTGDRILEKDIALIVNKLRNKSIIEKWFFIRYADPETHLRIRFLLRDESLIGIVIQMLYKQFNSIVKSNLLWKIQIDTYNRELERYGNQSIEDAESIFCIDSDCVLSIIRKLNKIGNENYRWMIALKLVDCFLSDFSLDIQAKQKLMLHLSTFFKSEFGFDKYNSKQFNNKFRENKETVEAILNNKLFDENFRSLNLPINKRTKQLTPIIKSLKSKLDSNRLELIDASLLASYIHMTLNRLFRSKNRMHELILYDYLNRYYTSAIARSKYNSSDSKNK